MRALPIKTTHARAAERTSFDLNYSRTEGREFTTEGISGPMIDNAFYPGDTVSGEWIGDYYPVTDENDQPVQMDWVFKFFNEAIHEAIHEALEWLQVDGQPVLNPHDPRTEPQVFAACRELTEKLYSLSERGKRAKRGR